MDVDVVVFDIVFVNDFDPQVVVFNDEEEEYLHHFP